MIVNALEFAKKTGYPVAMIRAFCREGKISHWQRGRVYWLDENEALAEMQLLKSTTIYKKKKLVQHQIVRKPIASGSGSFDYRDAIRQMMSESKSK